MEKKYFKLINSIDYIDIKKNTIIIQKEDGKFYSYANNYVIDKKIIDIIRENLIEITIMFHIDDIVVHTFNGGEHEFVVTDIEINSFGKPQYTLQAVHINATCVHVYEADIKAVNVYWFINSEGDISSTIFGKKKWADDWRMKIHNYYSTKELAQKALNDMKVKYI